MIGTALVERLVRAVAVSHRLADYPRVSLLLLAAPESGKTTIATSGTASHIAPIAVLSARSVYTVLHQQGNIEYLLFNDLSAIRALSHHASMLLITLLNQLTQGERGLIGFAGGLEKPIERAIGIIGCMPFTTFCDHRAKWKEVGFISRMLPFAYCYPDTLIAQIKDSIDVGTRATIHTKQRKVRARPISIGCDNRQRRIIRDLSDARAKALGQYGIRLLKTYHALVRASALLDGAKHVRAIDLEFLHRVDRHVSITNCQMLERA